jgi:arachidonate 15-lipoxygenase
MWRLRRRFWSGLMIFKFRHNRPLVTPIPEEESRPLYCVPMRSRFADLPISAISVADRVPRDEVQKLALFFCRAQAWLARVFSPMEEGLPQIDADPYVALETAYTKRHERCCPKPLRPEGYDPDLLRSDPYDGNADLGYLAMASPYACYLEQDGEGGFVWDLSGLDGFEVHGGLRSPWSKVQFEVEPNKRYPVATRIDCELGSCKSGDPDWAEAKRIAMCGLSTHLSLVRHFNWVHLVSGDPLALVTRNYLPVDHPIRRLLQPHVYATQSSDQMVTIVQMNRGGDFESTYSYTHQGMCDLFENTCQEFDLRMIHPELNAQLRGVADAGFEQPAVENRVRILNVIQDHVVRYLELYFDDHSLAEDGPFGEWILGLNTWIPHGVGEILGRSVSIDSAARLLTTFIYQATVEHEIIDTGVWDYQLWSDVQPARVYRDGQRQPLDIYERFVHANFNFQIPRALLMQDFSYLALDQPGASAFKSFYRDLAVLQRTMDKEPAAAWRIEPKNLKASINA